MSSPDVREADVAVVGAGFSGLAAARALAAAGADVVDLDGRMRRYTGTIPRVGLGALLDLAWLR